MTAIGVHLTIHLPDQFPNAESAPSTALAEEGTVHRNEEQPDNIGKIVIRRSLVASLQVAANELSMLVKARMEPAKKLFLQTAGGQEVFGANQPVGRPNGRVHGACPVHSESNRVVSDPVVDLVDELRPVPGTAGQNMPLPECMEMLESGQFPRSLDFDATNVAVLNVAMEGLRAPPVAALEIAVPVQRLITGPAGTEPRGTASQQVKQVIADQVGPKNRGFDPIGEPLSVQRKHALRVVAAGHIPLLHKSRPSRYSAMKGATAETLPPIT